MVVMKDAKKEGLNMMLVWSFVFCLVEIFLLWGLASQFSYLVYVKADTSGTHLFIIFGLIVTAIIAVITMGFAAVRASERWSNQRCRKLFGIDGRLMYKSEVLIIMIAIIGTLTGTGVWDMVTTVNALMDSGYDLSVFYDDYLVVDMILFQIVWPLWLHTTVGGIKALIGVILAIIIGNRVHKGTFCEL